MISGYLIKTQSIFYKFNNQKIIIEVSKVLQVALRSPLVTTLTTLVSIYTFFIIIIKEYIYNKSINEKLSKLYVYSLFFIIKKSIN